MIVAIMVLLVTLLSCVGLAFSAMGLDGVPIGTVIALLLTVLVLLALEEWRGWKGQTVAREKAIAAVSDIQNAPGAPSRHQHEHQRPAAMTPPPSLDIKVAPMPAQAPRDAARRFPQPGGLPGTAAQLPWRLPSAPGPSGICADSALVGDLEVRAASIVGPGHRCKDPADARQDAYRLGLDKHGRYLIVTIADGMSDSRHSHLGANVAADTIVKHLQDVMADGTWSETELKNSFHNAAARMTATAEQRGLTRNDVRAAALAAVIDLRPCDDGTRIAVFASIADVSAWLKEGHGWRQIAGDAKQGYDAGRLSEYLPHLPSSVRITQFEIPPDTVLALTTDGVGDALAVKELGAWFADQWNRPPFIGDFITSVGYETKGFNDDRTAVVLWCPGRYS
ncbi:protein phosphatase 2C domain-containing protein [Herbidospora mongoliensis]|uniref:protein phosphatase 2C domain-containing protein n=1 Tax=Herbidospora mongoliensis TaxID=688067 RepID=UPI001C3F1721|nr:protein phosphatase 2C domain-containing protein [Herbidospora mongoliensis]